MPRSAHLEASRAGNVLTHSDPIRGVFQWENRRAGIQQVWRGDQTNVGKAECQRVRRFGIFDFCNLQAVLRGLQTCHSGF